MNKSDLVDAVIDAADLERKRAEAAVSVVIDTVMAEAKAGNKVSIFGFGTFVPTKRAARTGRNPQTGAPVKIAASKGVRFAPASAFKELLNGKKAAAKKSAKKSAPVKKSGPAKKSPAAKRSTTTKTVAKKASSSRKR